MVYMFMANILNFLKTSNKGTFVTWKISNYILDHVLKLNRKDSDGENYSPFSSYGEANGE